VLVQQKYCCKQGLTLLSSAAVCYQLRLWAGQASLGFCFYLVLINHYWAAVPGGRFSNIPPSPSLNVSKHYNENPRTIHNL